MVSDALHHAVAKSNGCDLGLRRSAELFWSGEVLLLSSCHVHSPLSQARPHIDNRSHRSHIINNSPSNSSPSTQEANWLPRSVRSEPANAPQTLGAASYHRCPLATLALTRHDRTCLGSSYGENCGSLRLIM